MPVPFPEPAERALLDTLLADQRRRWRQGQPLAVEDYLRQQPALAEQPDAVVELIYNEVLLREQRGETPRLEDYLSRFPHLADELALQFQAHALLPLSQADTDLRGGTSPMPGPPVSLSSLLPRVEGYEVLEKIGEGGMGVVYKARHLALDRLVALKMLPASALTEPELRERFQREARAVARLHQEDPHPNVVQVFEVGTVPAPLFSMELVAGGSLEGRLKKGTLAPSPAARLVELLARAMHHTHQRGIVHRDLKPANVLLAGAGDLMPRITDFGLAKRLDAEQGHTQEGMVMGTAPYMAPEQARGRNKEVGPAADVYALGAILYECLTGRPPFKAATTPETLLQVISKDPVPPRQFQPKVPPDLEAVCLKCLEKEPARRYASAAALADDLARFGRGEPTVARPLGRVGRALKWAKRRPAIAALLAALAGVTALGFGLVTWQWQEAELARRQEQALAETERLAKGQAESEKQHALAAGKEADRQRRQAQRLNVTLTRERGLTLCEHGDTSAGLLWLARGLGLARKAGADDEERSLRTLLAHWAPALHHPRAVLTHPGAIEAVALSPDGRTVLTGCKDHDAVLWDARTGKRIALLRGHRDAVIAVAFSADSKRAVTASRDKTARLWDATTGKSLGPPLRHRDAVSSVAFNGNGRMVLTASGSAIRRWDASTLAPVGGPLPAGGYVQRIVFSPDGKTLVTATENDFGGSTRLWEAATGKPIGKPLTPRGPRTITIPTDGTNTYPSIAFSPDSKTVVTAWDNAHLWDAATAEPVKGTFNNPGLMQAVAISPDGKTLLTGSNDHRMTAQLWDLERGGPLGAPLHHRDPVKAVAFSPDGRLALTGSEDQTARLWEVATGAPWGAPLRHERPVQFVAFGAGGTTVVTADDRTVRVWAVGASHAAGKLLVNRGFVGAAAFSPDGKVFVTGGWDSTARLWDAATGQPHGMPLDHDRAVSAVAFGAGGQLLVTGTRGGVVRFWDAATGQPSSKPLQHPPQKKGNVHLPNGAILGYDQPSSAIEALAVSPDGKIAVSASNNNTAQLWDVAAGRALGAPLRHDAQVLAVAFSPDSKTVFTASPDRMVRRWAVATGKPVGKVIRCAQPLWAMALSPNGKTLVMAGGYAKKPSASRLWSLDGGAPIGSPLRHQGRVLAVAFSPDGTAVLTGSDDGTARLWDAVTGKPLGEPMRQGGAVQAVAFGGDGALLATGSDDGTVRLWDAATGKPLGIPYRQDYPVQVVALHPRGTAFATGSGKKEYLEDHRVRHWGQARFRRVPAPLTADPQRITLWLQVNTGMELDPRDRVVALDEAAVRQRWRELEKRGGPPRR